MRPQIFHLIYIYAQKKFEIKHFKTVFYDSVFVDITNSSVVHSVFWDKDCEITASKGATIDDIIDTAYAIMFFDVAIKRIRR